MKAPSPEERLEDLFTFCREQVLAIGHVHPFVVIKANDVYTRFDLEPGMSICDAVFLLREEYIIEEIYCCGCMDINDKHAIVIFHGLPNKIDVYALFYNKIRERTKFEECVKVDFSTKKGKIIEAIERIFQDQSPTWIV